MRFWFQKRSLADVPADPIDDREAYREGEVYREGRASERRRLAHVVDEPAADRVADRSEIKHAYDRGRHEERLVGRPRAP